jgi:hypothetical protein
VTGRTDRVTGRRPRGALVFVGAFLVLAALCIGWAIATPVAAAPDEPAHMIKAASVVRGQFIGEPTATGHRVEVPRYVAYTADQAGCYAYDSDESAACIPATPADEAELVPALTTAGLYNPLYYLVVGWPTLLVGDVSGLYLMRIASGVAVSLFLAAAVALVSRWRRPTIPLLGLAVTVTPMVAFLGGTVNPNSLEIAATLTTFVAMMTAVSRYRTVGLGMLGAIVAVSAAVAANTRGLSLIWVAVAVLAPLFLLRGAELLALLRRRAIVVAIVATAVSTFFALYWVLSTSSLTANVDAPGEVTNAPGVGASSLTGFTDTLLKTFDYGQGIVGLFGWLDTPAPLFVYSTWSFFIGAVFVAAAALRGRALWMTGALVGALLVVPALVQGFYITEGGIIWQGRYTLPLFVVAVTGACLALADRVAVPPALRTRLVSVVMVLWAAAHFGAFVTTLRRYTVGLDLGWGAALGTPEWSPPGGIPLVLAAFTIALVAAGAGVLFLSRSLGDESRPLGDEGRALGAKDAAPPR